MEQLSSQLPNRPRLENVTQIENMYFRWSRRIKPPTEYRRGFNEIIADLFATLSRETGCRLNDLRSLPESFELPPHTSIIFRELWEYYREDWFMDEPEEAELHVPN
jgi:hypothetical protein